MNPRRTLLLSLWCLAAAWPAAGRAGPGAESTANLLKNGSFEGGKRYWFQAEDKPLARGDAADGEFALRIEKGAVQSAAFLLDPAKAVTIAFYARADADTTVGWQCTPASREVGVKARQAWGMKAQHPVKITPRWKRYSFSFTPAVPQNGFWPRPTYMLQFGDGDKPWLLDGVTVAYNAGADAYVPRREVEVLADCPDLKGYRDPSGNLLEKGATVTLTGAASNPGARDRDVTLRWQLIDYEGDIPLGPRVDKTLHVPAGKVVSQGVPVTLAATGMVLGRVSAVADDGKIIDSSDVPLCSLPYPKSAARPDARERFGGSLFGPHNAGLCARLGFAWTRWRPHMNWADHQKNAADAPEAWTWFDKVLDEQEARGISTHAVLYGKPKWAFASEKERLPQDMQWAADDPRWEEPAPRCGWDKFVVAAVTHYKGRSLIYEIENEPELDGWDKHQDLYAKFTLRTARLIKQTDPAAKVMVDNVYAIPSALNRHLLERAGAAGAAKLIDVLSWHDYHEGWLADATALKRMRAALDDLGFPHAEIWFNEGWAYSNTVVDEPAFALTHLTSAQSTHAMVDSVAELTAAGQEKTILFHTGYEDHGLSFWDYAGPGTMLWDFYGYPLPLVPAWNTLAHHVGLSERAGLVRPEGATLCVFQNLRNARGVMVAYADRDARADVAVALPLPGLTAEDCMGNTVKLAGPGGRTLTLSKTGRPVFVYSPDRTSGKILYEKLLPLDRKNAGFVTSDDAGKTWKLPPAWEGSKKGAPDGNPALAEGKPAWRLDQVWPADPAKPQNYHPLAWRDGWWVALQNCAGGQPKAEIKDSALRLEFRASQGGKNPGEKLCALVFVAPEAGAYSIAGSAELKLWDGGNPVRLTVLHKTSDSAAEAASTPLKKGERVPLPAAPIQMWADDELVLLPRIDGMYSGGDVTLRDVAVSAAAGRKP